MAAPTTPAHPTADRTDYWVPRVDLALDPGTPDASYLFGLTLEDAAAAIDQSGSAQHASLWVRGTPEQITTALHRLGASDE